MYACVCQYMGMCTAVRRLQKKIALDPLKLEFQVIVTHTVPVMALKASPPEVQHVTPTV